MLKFELPWTEQPQEVVEVDWQSSQARDLFRFWPLNGTPRDFAGSAHGTLTNGASIAPRSFGQSLILDGTDDYVVLPTENYGLNNTFTLCAWIFTTSTARQTIFGAENAVNGLRLEINATAAGSVNYHDTNGHAAATGSGAVALNTWTHVALGRDGPGTSGTSWHIWVNGRPATLATNDTSRIVADSSSAHTIGRRLSGNQQFAGAIADVRLYKRWLGSDLLHVYARPHEVFAPRSIPIPVSAGGGGVNLVIADSAHAHTADNLGLTLDTYLALQDALHAHAADNLGLTLDTYLAVNEALHAHTADNLTLSTTGATNLTVADAAHAHAADNLGLTLDTYLTIAEALHAHAADNVVLSTGAVANLVIADGAHAHAADNLAFTLDTWLAIADALHAHGADNLILTLLSNLTIADTTHAHTADNVVLAFPLGALSDAEFRQMYDWLNELALIHGLIAASPMTVTPTTRSAGAVSQTIGEVGTTITVTRT